MTMLKEKPVLCDNGESRFELGNEREHEFIKPTQYDFRYTGCEIRR